jgi:hypothetical protein
MMGSTGAGRYMDEDPSTPKPKAKRTSDTELAVDQLANDLLQKAGEIIVSRSADLDTLTVGEIKNIITKVVDIIPWDLSKDVGVKKEILSNLDKYAQELHTRFTTFETAAESIARKQKNAKVDATSRGLNLLSEGGLEAAVRLARLGGGDEMFQQILLAKPSAEAFRSYFEYQDTLPEKKGQSVEPRKLTQAKKLRTFLVADGKDIVERLEIFSELLPSLLERLYKDKLSPTVQKDLYDLVIDFIVLSQPFTRESHSAVDVDKFDTLQVELMTSFAQIACYVDIDNKNSAKDFSIVISQLGKPEDHAAKILEILFSIDLTSPNVQKNAAVGLFHMLFTKFLGIVKEKGPRTMHSFVRFFIVWKRAQNLYKKSKDSEAQRKLISSTRNFVVPKELLEWLKENGQKYCNLTSTELTKLDAQDAVEVFQQMNVSDIESIWKTITGGHEEQVLQDGTNVEEETLDSINNQLFDMFKSLNRRDTNFAYGDIEDYEGGASEDESVSREELSDVREDKTTENTIQQTGQSNFEFVIDRKKR